MLCNPGKLFHSRIHTAVAVVAGRQTGRKGREVVQLCIRKVPNPVEGEEEQADEIHAIVSYYYSDRIEKDMCGLR